MLWEFKNNKNATETAKKISCVYTQGAITERSSWNHLTVRKLIAKYETGFQSFNLAYVIELWIQARMLIRQIKML